MPPLLMGVRDADRPHHMADRMFLETVIVCCDVGSALNYALLEVKFINLKKCLGKKNYIQNV